MILERQKRRGVSLNQSRAIAAKEAYLHVSRMAAAIGGAILLITSAAPASAEPTVTELPLTDVGIQRVLHASPANPRAALIMLPGGNGMVEFGPDAGLRRMGGSFLLRMLPLWRAKGFATAVLTPPNGMSLLGYRHTPAYATAIGEAVDFVAGRANVPVWLVGTSQGTTAAVGRRPSWRQNCWYRRDFVRDRAVAALVKPCLTVSPAE